MSESCKRVMSKDEGKHTCSESEENNSAVQSSTFGHFQKMIAATRTCSQRSVEIAGLEVTEPCRKFEVVAVLRL